MELSNHIRITEGDLDLQTNITDQKINSIFIGNFILPNEFKIIFSLNILAPILGVLVSKLITIDDFLIYIYLGVFSGSILYLAISDILPHAHADKNKKMPIIATVVGVLFVITITTLLKT